MIKFNNAFKISVLISCFLIFTIILVYFFQKIFDIKILDFTKISYPQFFEAHKEKIYKSRNYHEIQEIKKAKILIDNFDPAFVFDNMTPHSDNSRQIREFLKKRKIKTIHIQSGLVPSIKRKFFEK